MGDEVQGDRGLDELLMQFGKIGPDEFHMDVTPNLSIVMAFGCAISSLVHKKCC